MATASWTTGTDHQTDAGFRAWVADLITRLTGIGLVQTADTGQINTTTVLRPAVNTDGGYAVFRFADTLQATAPIFFRLDFGTGSSATRPRIKLTAGSGSDGAGAITGSAVIPATEVTVMGNSATGATGTHYLCYAEGFLALVWGASQAATGRARCVIVIDRTCDSTGALTATGALFGWCPTSTSSTAKMVTRCVRFAATARLFAEATSPVFIPGNESESATAGDVQNFLAFGVFPRVLAMHGLSGTHTAELTEFNTASMKTVGTTTRTMLCIGNQAGNAAAGDRATASSLCVLWE